MKRNKAQQASLDVQDAWDAFIDRLQDMKPAGVSRERWGALVVGATMGLTTALADRFDPKHAAAAQEAFSRAFDDIKKLDQVLATTKTTKKDPS